jgi:hypothetical protein
MPTMIGWAELLAVVLALVVPQPAATSAVTAVAAASGTKLRRVGRLINLLPSCDHAEAPVVLRCAERTWHRMPLSAGESPLYPILGPVPCAAPRTAFLLDPIYLEVVSSTSAAWD